MISAAELSSLRTESGRTLNTTATIMRKTSVSDGEGGTTDSYVVEHTYTCLFARSAVRPQEREATAIVEGIQQWTFIFESGTDILRTDRIVCQGRTFEVVGSGSGSHELGHLVICVEIT